METLNYIGLVKMRIDNEMLKNGEFRRVYVYNLFEKLFEKEVTQLTIREKNNPLDWLKHKFSHVTQGLRAEFGKLIESHVVQELGPLKSLLQHRLENHSNQGQALTKEEKLIINQIRMQAKVAGRNNVTRTMAYADFYQQYPDIHWAYLAHMVSRNGGWNMTDLKGDMLPRLLSSKEIEDFFTLLERCNWLIFQDAFPQLVLYAESKRRQQPLFHLLPHLNVSVFMEVIWNWFWKHSDSRLLSHALIMNEQNYIESRVIQRSFYQENVFQQAEFKTQALLHFNHVLFPYWDQKTKKVRLAGAIVEDFGDLKARIKVGKRLYALLFEVKEVAQGVRDWSAHMVHSGSRADYWPHIFSKSVGIHAPLRSYSLHLEGKKLHPKTPPLWSPPLEEVWNDTSDPEPSEKLEWFHDEKVVNELAQTVSPHPYDMTNEYYFALNKIEVAIVSKEKLLP
jgi:hypothetical protein